MRALSIAYVERRSSPALARHPKHPVALNAAVQLAAAEMLLKEGVEGGEQLGQGATAQKIRVA